MAVRRIAPRFAPTAYRWRLVALLGVGALLLPLIGAPASLAAPAAGGYSALRLAQSSDDLPGVDDDTYESPTWGYTLEWDDRDWEVVDATSDEDDGDLLVLTSEVSTLYIAGIAEYDGDERECSVDVGEVVASPDAFDLYPSESGDRDLDPEDYSYLIDCREIVAAEAVLLIVHVFPADDLGTEVVAVEAVIETLVLQDDDERDRDEEEDDEDGDDPDEDQDEDEDFADAGVDGESYTSPEFGYSLEWDPDIWEVTNAVTRRDSDTLNLVSDDSSLIISGIADLGDPDECLEGAVDFYSTQDGIEDWELFEDDDGDPIEGETRRRAFAAYLHTFIDEDGDDSELVNYIECRPLDDDGANLVISHLTTPRAYDDESDLRADILDTLEIS